MLHVVSASGCRYTHAHTKIRMRERAAILRDDTEPLAAFGVIGQRKQATSSCAIAATLGTG